VDPFDRFLRRTLEDVLVAQGVLPRERADEFQATAASGNVPFATVLLDSGTMTAWDLARTVSLHYQMPVQPLAGYRFDKDLFSILKPNILHRYQALPLGVFGRTRTFAVVEPPCRPLLDELMSACGGSLFFFAAEGPEVARALQEHVKVVDVESDGSWQKLFESAEQEVMKSLGDTRI
jgi:Type II secretion system (T2SS), protein E, N-terminal domain